MHIELDSLQTFALSLVFLFLGSYLGKKIKFFRTYNIPEPVIGGLIFSLLSSILAVNWDVIIRLDTSFKETMILAFFATVGLGANFRLIRQGGLKLLLFIVISAVFLFIQNGVGVGLAKALGLDPLVGLLAGSVTLSGGHGTGAIWAVKFGRVQGAMEIAMACATFGLVFGGIIGGPISQWLIARDNLAPLDKVRDANTALQDHGFDEPEVVTSRTMLEMVFIISTCIVFGKFFHGWISNMEVEIPLFVCVLFVGIILTNLFEITKAYSIPQQTYDLTNVLSLSFFLTMALMSLRLWELATLAGPLMVLITGQVLVTGAYTAFVSYRLMGKDYEAAVIAGGHCGFGLGATPTAVANMEAIVMRYGPAPQAFLTVPVVGAFFIDAINTGVIQLFYSFLG